MNATSASFRLKGSIEDGVGSGLVGVVRLGSAVVDGAVSMDVQSGVFASGVMVPLGVGDLSGGESRPLLVGVA